MKFAFIAKHRGIWPAEWLCGALGVSRGGFYGWLTRSRSPRSRSDGELGAKVRASFLARDRTYGARRNDGAWGASQTLDGKVSLNHVLVQVPGTASVIDSDHIRQLAAQHPAFRDLLVQYEQFFLAQVQQTAACNAVHSIQARACKWFLRMNDLVGPDLPLTQEFLAQMLGVRRSSVTPVAIELQSAGIISYKRGHIHIADLEQLRASACECDQDVRSHYRRIFELAEKDASLHSVHLDRRRRGSESARMFCGKIEELAPSHPGSR